MTKVAKKKNFNDLFRHFQSNTFSRKFEEASQGFCSMLARAPTLSFVFPETFSCFRFSRSLKAIKKKITQVRTIVYCSKYYGNGLRF